MPIRYLIGIDFGHGETTASYIDLEDATNPKSLHILDGQNADEDKVESCICKDKETGKWRFVKGTEDYTSPDFRIGFKQPMNEITPSNKEAFSAFIKLVFNQILKYQNFLRYNPATGERNFELCVACPSGWTNRNSNQIREYLKFMRSLIPVSWVIKESDAAYFKFKTKEFKGKSVLVVDIGSSTIDFTYYDPTTGRAKDPIGYPHGASHVERAILEYLDDNDETFQEGKSMILNSQEVKNGGNKNWLNAVRHFVKGQKEDFYTQELGYIDLNLRLRRLVGSLRTGCLIDCEIDKETLEGKMLKDYMNRLRNDFQAVAVQTNPEIVIMTGGASRMPWLLHLAKDVFTKDNPKVMIYKDNNPSYVVSHGIAAYALARTKFERKFDEAKATFWQEYTDEKLLEMVDKHFNDALRDIQLPMIKAFMDEWYEGKIKDAAGNMSTQAVLPYFIQHNEVVLGQHNEEIQKAVRERFNELFKETFTTKVNEIFIDSYNGHNPNIPLSLNVDIPFGGLKIISDYDRNALISITQQAYADFFVQGRIDKNRPTKGDRKPFYDKMIQVQSEALVRLPTHVLNQTLNQLKSKLIDYIEEVKRQAPFTIYE